MNGQLSIYDLPKEKPRPCDYKFQRYIGQSVVFYEISNKQNGAVGKIIDIQPYYTIVKTKNGELVGTPYSIKPFESEVHHERLT